MAFGKIKKKIEDVTGVTANREAKEKAEARAKSIAHFRKILVEYYKYFSRSAIRCGNADSCIYLDRIDVIVNQATDEEIGKFMDFVESNRPYLDWLEPREYRGIYEEHIFEYTNKYLKDYLHIPQFG